MSGHSRQRLRPISEKKSLDMLCKNYLPELMGSMTISSSGPFPAGSIQSLVFTYTAGEFGIDDTGGLRICWCSPSDMAKPQFDAPAAANYATVSASNGASLEYVVDRSG